MDIERFQELCRELIEVYPNPVGRDNAKKWLVKNLTRIEDMEDIVRAAKHYAIKVKDANLSFQYIKQIDRWLPNYRDYLPTGGRKYGFEHDTTGAVTDPTKIAEYSKQLKLSLNKDKE